MVSTADVAERLRRLTRNQFPSGSVDSYRLRCMIRKVNFVETYLYRLANQNYKRHTDIHCFHPKRNKQGPGPIRELNPGPLTPKERIILLDQ